MGTDYWPVNSSGSPTTSSGGSGQTINSLACAPMDENYHVHSHLSVFLDGRMLAVPAAIGIKNPRFTTNTTWPDGFASSGDCHYPLHTHDTSGRLHVESPEPATFTLGQVFKLWGQPLTRSNFAGITGKPIVIYIHDDGPITVYNGDPAAIELKSHREITVQIGGALSQIPTYTWYGP
jgi:hypothetical protein